MGTAGDARVEVSEGGVYGQGSGVPGRSSQALGSRELGPCPLGWMMLRRPCPSMLLGQEAWVWSGLAELGAGPKPTWGRKWPWIPAGMGWPPRGHFLPGNILPGSRREGGFSLGRQEGPGVQCPLVSSGRALGDPRRDQLSSWMSESLELKDLCLYPRPQAELLKFPAWSALSFRGWDLRP